MKDQEIEQEDVMYLDKTPEYWLGMYDTLHEADVSKFVMHVDVILKKHYTQSAIARFRAYHNLSHTDITSVCSNIFQNLFHCF
ncbi:MAG: hypothetical protein J6B94_04675 [Lachnospiraceae bacterium]|nr:hypothetical protein [Lachnospiraceae bacterium]